MLAKPSKNPTLNKSVIRLLIVVLIWCNCGFIVWNLARSVCYYTIHAASNSHTDTLKLTTSESASIVWMGKDEVKYNNRMFDIKKRIESDGKVILVGKYDETEDHLYNLLSNLINDGRSHSSGKKGYSYVWSYEAVVNPILQFSVPLNNTSVNYPEIQSEFFNSFEPGVLSPPPDEFTV